VSSSASEAVPSTATAPDVVLASASPRRRELLERMGLRLHIEPADVDEAPLLGEAPRAYVQRVAGEKQRAVAERLDGRGALAGLPVLAADTSVVLGALILGKPADPAEAEDMLRRLSGRRHEVLTAYRAGRGERVAERVVATAVTFRLLDPAEIAAYVASGEWQGKAGGYAIQGIASAFCTDLRGSLTNVIGLPLAEVLADLRALGALTGYPAPGFGVTARGLPE
jgi:septum formation protein